MVNHMKTSVDATPKRRVPVYQMCLRQWKMSNNILTLVGTKFTSRQLYSYNKFVTFRPGGGHTHDSFRRNKFPKKEIMFVGYPEEKTDLICERL
jgi:hypothetical protein